MTLEQTIKKALKASNMTQERLANILGRKQTSISRQISSTNPRVSSLHEMLTILGYEIALSPWDLDVTEQQSEVAFDLGLAPLEARKPKVLESLVKEAEKAGYEVQLEKSPQQLDGFEVTFDDFVTFALEERGLEPIDIARALKISSALVSNTRRQIPTLKTLYKYATLLGYRVLIQPKSRGKRVSGQLVIVPSSPTK